MALRAYRPASYPQIEAGVSTYLSSEFEKIEQALASLTENLPPDLAAAVAALQAAPISFSAHKNGTDQTISSTASTKVTFGTERWDTGSLYDTTNSRWTPPAGLVQLNARVTLLFTNAVDQTAVDVTILKNGSAIGAGDVVGISGATTMALGATVLDQANGTDFYEAFITISSVASGNRTIFGGAASTFFQGHVIK